MARLITSSAFFALPGINPFTLWIVTKLVTYLTDETSLGLSLLWISVSISYEVATVEDATNALKKMIDNPGEYSAIQSKEIEANFDDNARRLIRLSITQLH